MLQTSKNLYQKLQKQYSRRINLDLKRIKKVLERLNNPEQKLNNVINIIGSDGKNSVLTSLKYFLEANNQKVKLKLYSAFQRLGFNPIKSHANFILVNLQQNADKITEKILQKGIIVRKPKHPRLSTYIRVSLGKENEIERFIDTIKEIF